MYPSISVLSLLKRRVLPAIAAAVLIADPAFGQQITGNVSCTDSAPANPLPGITVVARDLQGPGGSQSTMTDSNGNYSFTLVPGFYEVSLTNLDPGLNYVNPPNGIHLTPLPPDLSVPANFTLAGCGSEPLPGELGNRVWEDLNCDGIQDSDEPGVPDVVVKLADCDGVVSAETITDADGYYWFTDLAPRTYVIQFVAPPAYEFSPPNQGGDTGWDSDADPETGATVCITLEEGQSDDSWDAGLCQLEAPGVRSQGYWKNHPDEWPVDEIEIGEVSYDKWDAILTMQLPTKGDKWLNLFEQLVAAKLNVVVGNDADCIEDTIMYADIWMADHPGPVRANSAAWKKEGRHLHSKLDDYNNGYLCAPYADW